MSLVAIGLGIAAVFGVGVVLIFVDIDLNRRRTTAQAIAVQAELAAGYQPPPPPPPAAGLRERVNRILAPAADRISDRGVKKGKPSLADQLAKADLKLRPSEFLMIQIGTVVLMVGLSLIRFGISPHFVLAGVTGYFLPGRYVRFRQGHRLRAFNNQLGDTLILLANALKTGYALPQAIDVVAKKGAPPVSTEFGRVVREMNLGMSPETAMAKMVNRIESPDLDLVVSAVAINQSIGGNLAEILENISGTIRDRVRIKGEIQTLTAQARASGYIITGLPIVLGVFMYFVTPAYFRPMLENWIGWVMLGIGAGLIIAGQTIISKIVAIKV